MNPQEIVQMTRSFVTPRELSGSRPRDVQLNAAGRFVHVLALVLFGAAIAAGILLTRLSVQQSGSRDAIDRTGVTATAEVTRLWRQSKDSRPWVAYRFEAGGIPYAGQSRMQTASWRALQTGSLIGVRYLPNHPETSYILGSEPRVIPAVVAFLLVSFLATAGVLILWGLTRQRRLLMDGRAAAAVVTAIVDHKTSHGGNQRSIKYTFPLLSGAIAKGQSDAPRKVPAIGSVICVVYDPDRPQRSRRYPFPFVQTARL